MHYYSWLIDVLREGWMKFLPSFSVKDCCKKCNKYFTHMWLDTLNKKTYLMCIPCRNEWRYYNRRVITNKEKEDKNDD